MQRYTKKAFQATGTGNSIQGVLCIIVKITQHYLPMKELNIFPSLEVLMAHNLPKVSPSLPSPLLGSYILPKNKTSSSSWERKAKPTDQIRYTLTKEGHTNYAQHTVESLPLQIPFVCLNQ